jgi:small GTP-binding protein
MRISSLVED